MNSKATTEINIDYFEELKRKADVYDDVMAIVNHKDYLFTFLVADLVNNSEISFFNERAITKFVDVRMLRESEDNQ